MRPSHVVITGGAGFIGSHLCERYLREGHRVTAVDSLVTGQRTHVERLSSLGQFDFIEADITQGLPALAKVDVVLHFASPASPIDYQELPVATMLTGSHGTLHALDTALEHGARFVLASTSEVYGDPEVHPQPESYWGHVSCIGPRSVYDEAKRFAEALTMAYRRSLGVNTGIIRIFNTYGPRMRQGDGRVVPTFLAQAMKNEPLVVFGDGRQTRCFCYIDDLVEGVTRVAESDHSGPVNLGNPEEISIKALAQRCIDAVPNCTSNIVHDVLPTQDPRRRRPDITQATDAFDWRPTISLSDGLARCVAVLRSADNNRSCAP